MMGDDLEFGEKPRTAKRGRRADAGTHRELTTIGLEEEVSSSNQTPEPPPRRNKESRRGGWGEETKGHSELDDARFELATPRKKDDEDSDNDIPVIPDLEERQEHDLSTQIAMAPTNTAVNRVATFRELDNDLLRHATFLTLDNETDLKLLAKGLSAESEVMEEDKFWDWDRLFTEVSSELSIEWEQAKKMEAES